ncbi:MAG: ThiF family adenylyltransferase [Gammaproteobacteria bacterium]|nr:ThiF family adenylyltransferase [Gammaproteobacteria bacterium]
MIELVLAADDADTIRGELTGRQIERCAILYASQTVRADRTVRLLVREIEFPTQDDYTKQGYVEAELSPEFVARVTKRARGNMVSLIFVHSHPGTEAPIFSDIDSLGEERLAAFLAHRHPAQEHAALVVSEGGMRARRLGKDEGVRIIVVGSHREVIFDPVAPLSLDLEIFDRQVRAFGSAGQQALQRLRIAIVGLGGTGSIVAQQLVHLGVQDFILVDPDVLESTNLNRVANALPGDIGHPKVEIAARYINAVAKYATVTCIEGDVTRSSTAKELLNADIIFGCTDSHGSRAVLQQISYQYLIPCIDVGTTIAVSGGSVTYIYGRVQLLAPGHACFTCSSLLDANEVRRDMMSAFERQSDPYIQGAREHAPAVMSLNGTVVSLAVTMLLSMAAGIPVGARHILYNAVNSVLKNVRAHPNPTCYICSRTGSFARGDSWPLLARQDQDGDS